MTAKPVRKRSFVKDAKPVAAGLLLGYARVSKGDEQNNALQSKALTAKIHEGWRARAQIVDLV